MRSIVLGLTLLFVAGIAGALSAEETKPAGEPAVKIKSQTHCPVMGGVIDRTSFVDHDGKRIYMCCDGCRAALKKDAAKHIRKLEAQGITLDKTPQAATTNAPAASPRREKDERKTDG